MSYDPRRVVLLLCCVCAVVVAGSYLPAAGYGDYPDAESVDEDQYDGGSGVPDESGAEETGTDDGEDGATPSTETERRGDTDTAEATTTEASPTPDTDTDTEADTNTETDAAATESGDGGSLSTPLLDVIGVVGVLASIVLYAVLGGRRWDPIAPAKVPDGLLPRLRFRLRRIPQVTMVLVMGAARLPSILDRMSRAASIGSHVVSTAARDASRGLGDIVTALPAALSAAGAGLGALVSLPSGALTVLSGIPDGLQRSGARRNRDASAGDPGPGPGPETVTTRESDAGPRSVEAAWEAMVEGLPVRRRRTLTPGELARRAIETGLPAEAVSTLTTTFREVRYGDLPRSAERTKRARAAFERIERARTEDSNGGDDR